MPSWDAQRQCWRGIVVIKGRKHRKDFKVKRDAIAWEANIRRELKEQENAGFGRPLETEMARNKQLEWLDDAASKDLRSLLRWWRDKQSEPSQVSEAVRQRPLFKGKRRNTGLHINEEILTRAMQKAKTDKVRTGGSLSLLVEFLLWQYIGSPSHVLETIPSESLNNAASE